jgi:hypothetical protein
MHTQCKTEHRAATVTRRTLLAVATYEQPLKWLALVLGISSTLCVVQGWQLQAMALSLPFCLIWIYFGWLRSERQLQYINMVFAMFYFYGIARHFIMAA